MHAITPPKNKKHYINSPSAGKDALKLTEDNHKNHKDAKNKARIISESVGLIRVCLHPDACII